MNYYQDSGELIIRLYTKDDYTVKYQVCKNTKITAPEDTISREKASPTGRTLRFSIGYSTSDSMSYNSQAMYLTERKDKSGPIKTKSSYDLKEKVQFLTEMIKEAGGIVLGKDDKYFNRENPKKVAIKLAEKKITANKLSKVDFLKEINNFT